MKNEKGLFIKNPNFWRVPRKKKKLIPKDTFYCYTPTSGMMTFKDGTYGYKIKTCAFLDYIKYLDMPKRPSWMDDEFLEDYGNETTSWCKLVKTTIDDQCKSCGLKYGI